MKLKTTTRKKEDELDRIYEKCRRCGITLHLNDWGGFGDNSLTLLVEGGYSDMIDTAFYTKEEYNAKVLILCHRCGHKLINWVGNTEWINPISTGSHHGVSKWHYGWDNTTFRGYISATINALIYFGIKSAVQVVKDLNRLKRWKQK